MPKDIEANVQDTAPPDTTMVEKEDQSSSHQSPSDSADWDGPDDPDKPLNWPKSKRWLNTMLVSVLTLLTCVPPIK